MTTFCGIPLNNLNIKNMDIACSIISKYEEKQAKIQYIHQKDFECDGDFSIFFVAYSLNGVPSIGIHTYKKPFFQFVEEWDILVSEWHSILKNLIRHIPKEIIDWFRKVSSNKYFIENVNQEVLNELNKYINPKNTDNGQQDLFA